MRTDVSNRKTTTYLLAALLIAPLAVLPGVARAGVIAPGERAPEFVVQDLSGARMALAEQRGKLVLLSFFAKWCGPCREEVPVLNELAAKYPDTLSVFAIGYEEPNPAKLRAVAEDFGFKIPVLVDTKETLARGYGVTGLPRGILIDPYGYVIQVYKGMSEKLAGDLRARIAKHSKKIIAQRGKGLRVFIENFENVDDRGKQNQTGQKTAGILRKAVAAAGIATADSAADSSVIISGTVSDLGPIVGVELVVQEPEKRRELGRDRASIIGGKNEGLTKACLKLLEPYRGK